jgi:hypothetical protein
MQALDKIGATDPVEVVKELTYAMRPQDPHADGTGLRFETGEHGGDFPDNMPQAITLTDAQGMGRVRSATGGR